MEHACHGVRSRTRAARFRVAAFLHSHEMGHCSVSFPLARSRVAAFLLSHPCGGRMVHRMERECRIHKDKEPQGSSPYAAVAGATIPVALYKANFFQLEHRLLPILSVSHFLRHIPHTT